MLAHWIVVEAQEIFRQFFFTPEWLANKHNTTIPAIEQLQKLAEVHIFLVLLAEAEITNILVRRTFAP